MASDWFDHCEAASSLSDGNITLASAPSTIGGVAAAALNGKHVLLRYQSTSAENRTYLFTQGSPNTLTPISTEPLAERAVVRVNSGDSRSMTYSLVDLVHYRWVRQNESVNVRDFGARGDGVLNGTTWSGTDDTAAIQSAIDFVLATSATVQGASARLFFPAGAYLITGALIVARNVQGRYDGVCIELFGEHRTLAVGVSELYRRASYIVQRSTTEPALGIQAARGVTVRNLGFIGRNIFPSSFTYDSLLDDATFVNGTRDDKYSPNAAIVIDPFKDSRTTVPIASLVSGGSNPTVELAALPSGLVVGDFIRIAKATGANLLGMNGIHQVMAINGVQVTLGSPGITGSYDAGSGDFYGGSPPSTYGYPGLTSRYVDSTGSSGITIEGCSSEQFTCGVVVAPTASGGNTENIYIRDCSFQYHKVAIAVCQTQSRNVVVENVAAADQQFFISTRTYGYGGTYYGDGKAAPPFVHKCNVGGTKYVFNVDLGSQNFHVSGLYVESSLSIGYIGPASFAAGNQGATLSGCSFTFWAPAGRQIDFHLFNYAPVEFRGSSFVPGNGGWPIVFLNYGPLTIADSAILLGSAPHGMLPIAFETPEFVQLDNVRVLDQDWGAGFANFARDYAYDSTMSSASAVAARQPLASPEYVIEGTRLRVLGTKYKEFSVGPATLTPTATDGEATLVPAPPTGTLLPGDLVFLPANSSCHPEWYNNEGAIGPAAESMHAIAGVVKSVANGTVTLKYVPKSVWSTPPASAVFRIRYFARYRPNVTASITSGSSIVVCSVEDPTKVWKPNVDRIDHPLIPKGTYVTAITGTGPWTLTLSQAATGSDGNATLLDAAGAPLLQDGRTNVAVPSAGGVYTLLSETQGNRYATRIYAAGEGTSFGSGYVLTHNAKWNGGQWDRDTSAYPASKFSYLITGSVRSQLYTGGSDLFYDSAWTDSLTLPSLSGAGALAMSSAGEMTSTGSTNCFLAADGYGSGQTKLGAGCNFRKRFPATPSSYSWTLHSSQNVNWPPTITAAQAYGLGAWCNVTQTGSVNWYASVQVT